MTETLPKQEEGWALVPRLNISELRQFEVKWASNTAPSTWYWSQTQHFGIGRMAVGETQRNFALNKNFEDFVLKIAIKIRRFLGFNSNFH